MKYSKADTHIHTSYSDGNNSPEDIVEAAAGRLDVIAVTDHNRIKGAFKAKEYALKNSFLEVDVIIGEEISTKNGHVVGLFLENKIIPGKTAQETIDEIHSQGGLAIAPHPYYFVSYAEKGYSPIRKLLSELDFDAVEVINNSSTFSIFSNAAASLANVSIGLPQLGVSDAHRSDFIGKGYTGFYGKTALDLRSQIKDKKTTAHFNRYSLQEFKLNTVQSAKSFYFYFFGKKDGGKDLA
ncbi:MAG: PHP domain-containing protein [Deltaproteobacteria bacterium]|nr:PHP domain-containing protein [Deltaproteobacteria bacterium]